MSLCFFYVSHPNLPEDVITKCTSEQYLVTLPYVIFSLPGCCYRRVERTTTTEVVHDIHAQP